MDPTYHQYEQFSPHLPEKVKVIKVYDGDTVTIGCMYGKRQVRFSVRMLGYDCAEIRSKDEVEKRVAHDAQKELQEMILGREVNVSENLGLDKYGRLLLKLAIDNKDVNEHMKNRWGVAYDGGHKDAVDWSKFPQNIS